jgi:catechol 2,3-dioxygenase-like lactoylglutathione lyase family enzyme
VTVEARFVHANIVARDWKELARFYERVFGCIPILPERDLAGQWLESATAVPQPRIRGIHLRLPGHGETGPTLEIFQYEPQAAAGGAAINRPGLAHLAFAVEDVNETRLAVLAAGGSQLGEVVNREITGAGTITFVYLTDPEGNIIEAQRWA